MVLFGRVKLSKAQLNRLGFGLIFGFVGLLISIGTMGRDNRLASLVIALVFAFIGYFGLGNRRSRK
jgi:hypothetical protein